jgi:sterol desaturase/sphingolipid hydroxylase (fatty acid hydroxylase superfamily)
MPYGRHGTPPKCPRGLVGPRGGNRITWPPVRGPATIMIGWLQWSLIEFPLCVGAAISTHLVMSCGQTLMHYWLGHRRIGGILFRNHINYHHARYARGHLTSTVPEGSEGNNTPYFYIPVLLAGAAAYFVLPLGLFIAVTAGAGASFYAHVWFDKAYHIDGSYLERFAWFRRKQQLHFVHHLHANANFAVIDFFWDRMLGTYREPVGPTSKPPIPPDAAVRAITRERH